jgi:hypothetical protein
MMIMFSVIMWANLISLARSVEHGTDSLKRAVSKTSACMI